MTTTAVTPATSSTLASAPRPAELDRPAPPTLAEAGRSFRQVLASVGQADRDLDRAVRRMAGGAELSHAELISLQTTVYQASRRAELVARAVDRVGDTVRELTQVRV